MRPKLNKEQKRNNLIGIKVQSQTKLQLKYIADREGCTISTLIDTVLKGYIENYLSIAKIQWNKLSPEERGEK